MKGTVRRKGKIGDKEGMKEGREEKGERGERKEVMRKLILLN